MAEFSSPIAGGLRIRRTKVSSFSFLNRSQNQQVGVDYGTTLALQQNSIAFNNINSSLVNISAQVNALSASLDGIAQRVREDSALDQAREAQKVRQEQILAEQKLREGKESVVERKMQSALLRPVRKIGNKARFTLGRLANFFMILLGGFLGNMALSTISALISGDKEKLEELKEKFLKNIGVVTGIFLLFSGGLTTILGYLTRLGARLGSAVFRNLLIRPVNALINLVKEGVKGIARGLGLKLKKPPSKTPPPKPTRPAKPPSGAPKGGKSGGGKGTATSGRPSSSGTFRSTSGITFLTEFLFGSTVGESGASALGAGAGAKTAQVLSNVLLGPRLGAIKTAITLIAGFTSSQAFKQLYQQSDLNKNPALGTSIDIFGAFTGDPIIKTPEIKSSNNGQEVSSLKESDTGGNVTVITNESTASAGNVQKNKDLGSANYLPSVPTALADNFFATHSQLVYNTGWA